MSNIKQFRIKSFKEKKPIISLKEIKLKYGKKLILDNLNLQLNKSEILGLLGPNGAGKSTIFNLIIGLIKPDFGTIEIASTKINNCPVDERASKFKIGFVPQYGGYFHDLTVYENLKAIGEIMIKNSMYIEERIGQVISKLELEKIKDIKADFLSGGQKKKLVIANCLISEPRILLLDEPFAALDVITIKMLQEIIVNLQSINNISIILCDHQARDLLACVDKAVIIYDGKIVAEGTPSNLIKDENAQNFYFGNSFKIS